MTDFALMRHTSGSRRWRSSWRRRRCVLCWLIRDFRNPCARLEDGGLLKVMLYRVVVLLPILEYQLAAETSDGVCALVAVVESSRSHCRRERFDVKRPGMKRVKAFVPRRHVRIVVPAATWSCPSMFSDWIRLLVPSLHDHVAVEARDCVGIYAVLIEASTCHEDGTKSTPMRPIGKRSDPILHFVH